MLLRAFVFLEKGTGKMNEQSTSAIVSAQRALIQAGLWPLAGQPPPCSPEEMQLQIVCHAVRLEGVWLHALYYLANALAIGHTQEQEAA